MMARAEYVITIDMDDLDEAIAELGELLHSRAVPRRLIDEVMALKREPGMESLIDFELRGNRLDAAPSGRFLALLANLRAQAPCAAGGC